jgi:acyl carrier protein
MSTTASPEVFDRVRTLVAARLVMDAPADAIAGDSNLIDEWGMDSAAILAIATALEDEFGVEIDDEEISREMFSTLDSLAGLVARKLAG